MARSSSPCRSFGIRSWRLPNRKSSTRSRWPLRQVVRSPAGWSVEHHLEGDGNAAFALFLDSVRLACVCVCVCVCVGCRSGRRPAAWGLMAARAPPGLDVGRPDAVTWLAVHVEAAAVALMQSALERVLELADAERCIAWMLLDRHAKENMLMRQPCSKLGEC
jgi:hypothetical protein